MNVKYVDAHCHMQFEQYAYDETEIIERMRENGVAGIVVGCDFESSKKAVELAERHEHLFASVGLHPNQEGNEWYEIAKYRELAQGLKVVAIGECGLDYFRPQIINDETKQKQKAILSDQITLAAELDKPLIIHCRPSKGSQDAYADLIEILRKAKAAHGEAVRGDIHFFVGGISEMQALIELGFSISFTAVITFARDYDAVIRAVPITSILSETDSPYVAPSSRRGQRNDPLAVAEVVSKIAEIRGEDLKTVSEILARNAISLFNMNR